MMLHIVTPLYRYENLQKIYESIPKSSDITWHIAKISSRKRLDYDFIRNDARIKVYEIACSDNDLIEKRNTILDNIKDGHFHLLDDDTVFHQPMYGVYERYKDFSGMVIGRQLSKDMQVRLRQDYPSLCNIDTGNVLCHSSILKYVQWKDRPGSQYEGCRDFVFWDNCYNIYGKSLTILIPEPISIYNKLA